jgi:hypothetical protein
MKHLSLELEKLEQRIAPGGLNFVHHNHSGSKSKSKDHNSKSRSHNSKSRSHNSKSRSRSKSKSYC